MATTPDFFPLSGTFVHEEAAQGKEGILGCFARNHSLLHWDTQVSLS